VAIISAKDAVAQFDSTTNALCLFAALGFLGTVLFAHWSTKRPDRACVKQFVTVSEWCFPVSLIAILDAGALLVL